VANTDVITDEMWEWIGPLLPSSVGKRGGQFRDHRQMLEAIIWRFRTGSTWRDLPERFGPWQSAWARHDLWCNDGTYHRLVTAAQQQADEDGGLGWVVSIDSSIVRTHQHATGAPSDSTGGSGESQEIAA
jgi:transposase